MKKRDVALTAGGAGAGGVVGYTVGRLTSTDLRAIIEKLIDLFKDQGPYAFYALLITVLFVGFVVWLVRKLIGGKDKEIERVTRERDKFEQLFINEWKTTRKGQLEEGKQGEAPTATPSQKEAKEPARKKAK